MMMMMLRNHQRKAETELELEDAGKKVAALRREIQNQARVIEELRDQVSWLAHPNAMKV
jgi:predicted RNase H-like nuclease (RuvC/YqgF family)